MPLTTKGKIIKAAMILAYGKEKGTRIFYASERSGKITGVSVKVTKRGKRKKK